MRSARMRRAGTVLALGAAIAALSGAATAMAASPPSLKVAACVNTSERPQMVLTQKWKNAIPADLGGPYDIVYSFEYAPNAWDVIDLAYLASAEQPASGTQTDTFESFLGTTGLVPWNTYLSVTAAWVVNGATTVSDTVTQPNGGWRTCK